LESFGVLIKKTLLVLFAFTIHSTQNPFFSFNSSSSSKQQLKLVSRKESKGKGS